MNAHNSTKGRNLEPLAATAKKLKLHPVTVRSKARHDPAFPKAFLIGTKIFFDEDETASWLEAQRLPKKGEPGAGASSKPMTERHAAQLADAQAKAKKKARAGHATPGAA